jgi:alpha-D-ribose 1-methylphosphonate 5-triphosphate synthase subunit PhnG
MKTNGTFKLSKQSKIHVCHYLDAHLRGEIRRSFIEAEVMKNIQPRVSKQKRDDKENTNA